MLGEIALLPHEGIIKMYKRKKLLQVNIKTSFRKCRKAIQIISWIYKLFLSQTMSINSRYIFFILPDSAVFTGYLENYKYFEPHNNWMETSFFHFDGKRGGRHYLSAGFPTR